MSCCISKASCNELWIVVNRLGQVMWTAGGSSTNRRIMAYDTEGKAYAGVKRQRFNRPQVKVIRVHKANLRLVNPFKAEE